MRKQQEAYAQQNLLRDKLILQLKNEKIEDELKSKSQELSQMMLIAEGIFELKFALFRVPDEKDTVFMIGPWTDGPRSEESHRWTQKNLGKAGDEAVQEYYNGVHTLSGTLCKSYHSE